MKYQRTTYVFTFEKVLRIVQKRFFLEFPGRYGSYNGPHRDRQTAWEQYVRILRECYFHDEPEKPVNYAEEVPIPVPYVPPTDYQI